MINSSGLKGGTYKRKFKWPNAETFFTGVAISIGTGLLIVACSQRAEESSVQKRAGSGNAQTDVSKDKANSVPSITDASGKLPLRTLIDVPLTGGTSRPRCLIIKSTRTLIRCLTNKSTRKEVAAERRSVPRSSGGWQVKVLVFSLLHLVYG